jgi:hypothetical protein
MPSRNGNGSDDVPHRPQEPLTPEERESLRELIEG